MNYFQKQWANWTVTAYRNPRARILVNTVMIIVIFTGITLLSLALKRLGVGEVNIIMTYLIGVLLASYFVEGFVGSTVASIMAVMLFNFFFTEPIFTFTAHRADYPITFSFMFIAGAITSAMTIRMKAVAKVAYLRERRTFLLYQLSQRLLKLGSAEEIFDSVGRDVSGIMHVQLWMIPISEGECHPKLYQEGQDHPKATLPAHHMLSLRKLAQKPQPDLVQKKFYDDRTLYYVPIVVRSENYGFIGFELQDTKALNAEYKDTCKAIASQMALAIERNKFFKEKQESSLQVESEQLKSNLLRAISHDLRTPLTSIMGSIGMLSENGASLDDLQKKKLLDNAFDEAQWLYHSVENILSMTQIEEGTITLKKKNEFIEEIIEEVIRRTDKLLLHHQLEVDIPEELLSIYVDGQLIRQVLINLIDNAVKYTPYGSTIGLVVKSAQQHVVMTVQDNGPGIPKASMDKLFTRFFTSVESSDRGRRGIGLGLEICKAIIEAHEGTIRAYNNELGGASFEIVLPLRR